MARRRDSLIPGGLAALAFLLALLQRPGWIVAETKVDLHVAPQSFLHDVLSAWTPQESLGHVFAGQYGGYLWPMAPFFALGNAIGIPEWVVGRLWIGLLLALSAWGMVRLLDGIGPHPPRPRGAAHLVGGALYMLNPYVVTYLGRTSITLLASAALPWLLLCVHRGLRDPRGLWWPAAFALVLTSTGGGVNVAVTAWLLLGPLLLALYELGWGGTGVRALGSFAARLVPLAALASLWWVAAVAVHARYGLDFLPYTEQPGTIWSTSSVPEALRLLGFWTSYIGVGYTGTLRAFQADAGVYLDFLPVVLATLFVPALCLGSFAWTRRARYAPFLLAMVLLGVLVMVVGFPNGTPLRRGATFAYNHVQAVRFLRTTYKAGPLVALGLAGLGGLGAALAWQRLRALPLARTGFALVCAGLIALTVWPLVRGVGLDRQLAFKKVPAAWKQTAAGLDRTLPRGDRAMVLPGQLFAYYRWGGTYDPILPALTDKPVAERFIVPFADLRSTDLQWSTDALVSQQRALPGQLRPLLDLMGVGAVIQGTDDDRSRSGGPPPADAAAVLASALGRPAQTYGPRRTFVAGAGTIAPPRRLAQVRRWNLPTSGMVRVLPRVPGTIVDGSAQGIVDLAGFGALPRSQPLRYAADLSAGQLRAAAAGGGAFVISDSNRRRVFVAARMRGDTGWTLGPDDPISHDAAQLDPFPAAGTAAQTVQVLGGGLAYVRAPFSPGFAQFPERRPFAALDGDPRTAWIADRALDIPRHRLDVGFTRARDVPYVDLLPYGDGRGVPDRIAIAGRTFRVHAGWQRLRLGLHGVRALSVTILHVRQPRFGKGGAGGISELRIPGLHPTEALRPPVLVQDALRGADLRRASLTYLFDRTTGDDPFHPRVVVGDRQRGLVRDQQDGETSWTRAIDPPAARAWRAQAWVTVAPGTPDHVLDRWAGARGATAFDGSSRFEGLGRWRASSAFDGDLARPWIAGWLRARGAWLQWSSPRPRALRSLRLVRARVRVRFPTRVRLVADGRPLAPVAVAADGAVPLPAGGLRARTVRIEVLAARFPAGTPALDRRRRAVGVAEVVGDGVPRAHVPVAGRLALSCADGSVLRLGASTMRFAVSGGLRALDAGRPLRATSCGAPVGLPASATTVHAAAAPWRVDFVRLTSPAPAGPVARAASGGGRVLDAGSGGRAGRSGVRVSVSGPSWLVLGQSYDNGWRASCDGRSLGAPVPIEGFANGWPVGRGCRDVSFSFGPNGLLHATDWISLAACVLLLALLLFRRPRAATASLALLAPRPARPWPLRSAIAAGVVAGLALAFVFAIRAGVVLGPFAALALWRGIGARRLALLGGALLLVVVPILHVAVGLPHTGYATNYAVDRIAEHWVAVLAICCLGAALWRSLNTATDRGASAPPSPASAPGSERTTGAGRAGAPR